MRYVSNGPLLLDVNMNQPLRPPRRFMDALLAFWPGLQVGYPLISHFGTLSYFASSSRFSGEMSLRLWTPMTCSIMWCSATSSFLRYVSKNRAWCSSIFISLVDYQPPTTLVQCVSTVHSVTEICQHFLVTTVFSVHAVIPYRGNFLQVKTFANFAVLRQSWRF